MHYLILTEEERRPVFFAASFLLNIYMPADGRKWIGQKEIIMYVVIVIGAGVSGAAAARELSS